jgi:cbb3-type cytochrome oxidase maturation protein
LTILLILAPISVGLAAVGLFAFWWTLRAGQYEDPKGDAARILDDRFDAAP